jgi:hypothetical protein
MGSTDADMGAWTAAEDEVSADGPESREDVVSTVVDELGEEGRDDGVWKIGGR